MIEFSDVEIDSRDFSISAFKSGGIIGRDLIEFINDLAEQVESKSKEFAPQGPTGRLKANPVIRTEASRSGFNDGGRRGEVVTDLPLFGGGTAVRGAGGRFVRAEFFREPGFIFEGGVTFAEYQAQVLLNPGVAHSIWVHNGTGIYGPYKTPIVPVRSKYLIFFWRGRKWMKKSVRGQKPQPFLTEAFEYVNNVYAPIRLSTLRAEIAAKT